RDEARDQDRHADGHGEFAEFAADDAAHEQHRDEHGDQRHGDRQDREGDLARAFEGGIDNALAVLDMAHDVLEHHDRVVDDEAYREGQRHQREIVDAIGHHLHAG